MKTSRIFVDPSNYVGERAERGCGHDLGAVPPHHQHRVHGVVHAAELQGDHCMHGVIIVCMVASAYNCIVENFELTPCTFEGYVL